VNCPICHFELIKRPGKRWYCMHCDHLVTFHWRYTVKYWLGGRLENELHTVNAGYDPGYAWRLVASYYEGVNYSPWLESRLEAIIS